MNLLRPFLSSALLLTAAIAVPAHGSAVLNSEWNFNSFASTTSTNGFGETILADGGDGVLFIQSATTTGTNLLMSTTGGTTIGSWESVAAGGHIDLRRGERWNNGFLELRFDMSNHFDLNLSFAANLTSTFPTTTTLQWSIDGGSTYTNFATITQAVDSTTNAFSLFVYESANPNLDFSALNNQPDVRLRFLFSDGGGPGSSGSGLWLDNVVVTAIPEPSSYAAVLGLVALGCIWRQRRSR